ncbi:MAG TPA: ABC transporter permease [Thermomicrobiales bacterium]|jgi:peptide/nickel transport system permease protein|nr:ABC transporter permease [Thermomicrobiales bacterium]
MGRFVLQRLIRSIITLWVVVTVVFVVLNLSGNLAATMLGPDASPEAVAAFRAENGLDDPLPVRYARYLGQLAQGDFGDSLQNGRPAMEELTSRVGATLELGGAAVLIAILIGIPAGVLAALRRNSVWDRGTMLLAFVGQSAPNFFVGIMLILLLSLQLNWLPSSGRGDWQQLIMPAVTLATGLLAALARMSRSSMLEVMSSDFVRTARAKGLSERRVVVGHLLRNAGIPVVTIIGLSIGGLIGGAAITETVFAWPGVGRLMVEAISMRDYPVVLLIVMAVATTVILLNLIVDITYRLLDPRIHATGGTAR